MKLRIAAVLVAFLALAGPGVPAVNTYQVTGPVLEVGTDKIVVQKGKDRWELARDASTKVNGDLKVGSKVTIEYRMTATTIDVKAETAAAAKKPAAKKP